MLIASFAIMAVSMAIVGTLLSAGVHSETMRILWAGMLLVFIVGFAMGRAAGVDPVRGDPAVEGAGVRDRLFDVHELGGELSGGEYVSDAAVGAWAGGTFWLSAALNAAFVPFALMFVPETKGILLEAIERRLLVGERLRAIGQQGTGDDGEGGGVEALPALTGGPAICAALDLEEPAGDRR